MLSQTPVDLEQIFGGNSIYPTRFGLQQIAQNQTNNQINQAGALQDLAFNEQVNPLKIAGKSLENQTTEAQLPGVRADSTSRQLKAEREQATQPDVISHLKAKLASGTSAEELAQVEGLGQQLTQWGNVFKGTNGNIPLELQGRIPQPVMAMFKSMGADGMLKMGDAMLRSSSEVRTEAEKQRAITEREKFKQEEATKRQLAVQQLRNQVASIRRAATEKAPKDPTTWQALAVRYKQLADRETDPEKRAMLMEEANNAANQAYALKVDKAPAPGAIDPTRTATTGKPTAAEAPVRPPIVDPKAAPADPYAGWKIK